MTKEKRLQKALTEEKYRCRMVKSKKSWVIKGMLFSTLLISGMSIRTSVYANEWSANTPESIQLEENATFYTLKNGDTLWAISQATNIKVSTLAEINNIDLNSGEQYSLEIGRVIYFDGNHVTIKDKDGNVVADKVLSDSDKVDTNKPFAGQNSDTQKNPVQSDGNGNVVNSQGNTSLNQNSDENFNSKNNTSGDNQNSNSNQMNTKNNSGQGNINKPVNPTNPVNPEKPTEKPEKPTNPEKPEVKKYNVSVIYKDTDGNVLDKEADVKVEEGKSLNVIAKDIEGYTLQGNANQTVLVTKDTTITFTYKKNAETPIPAEKFDVTIMHVDTEGNTIADTHTIKVEDGESYTATAETIEGYTLQGDATQTITVSKNTTIKFVYTKNVAPVEKFDVTVEYVDASTGTSIADKEVTKDVEKGQVFTAQAKEITGYTLTGDTTQTVTVNGKTTIKFEYIKDVAPINKYNVTVNYVDTEGNVLGTDVPVEVEEGKQFTATATNFEGYTLQGEAKQTITVTSDTNLTFTYSKDAVAPIVDKTELQTLVDTVKDTTKGNFTDESFTAFETNLGVAQSVLSDVEATQQEVDQAKSNLQTAFDNLVEKAPEVTKFKVTVMHRDTDGNILETESPVEVEENKQFTAYAKTFEGYTVEGGKKVTITVTSDRTVIFTYKKDAVAPVVDKTALQTLVNNVKDTAKGNYTDASYATFTATLNTANSVLTNDSATQQEVDTAKTNLQTAFDGLEEKEPVREGSDITVKYVTTDGIVLGTEMREVKNGDTYTETAKTFEGYTLVGSNTQTITVTEDTTITFTYKKDEVTPPVQDVSEVEAQIASQALALINQHRNNNGLISLNNQSALQQGADVRSNEIFTLYEHTRPNGEDGADAPYDYGYDQVVFCENIGMYNNPSSLEWLAQNGASIVVNAWINSSGHNANLLLDGLNEGSVGIHLEKQSNGKYTMGSVFLGAKNYSKPTKTRSVTEPKEQKELKFNIQETEVVEELPKETTAEVETTEETTDEETTTETTTEVESNVEDATTTTETATPEVEEVVEEALPVVPVNQLEVGNLNELYLTKEEAEAKALELITNEASEWFGATYKVKEVQMSDDTVQYGINFIKYEINKSELANVYNVALSLDETNYSVHSWSMLMHKLADAKYAYDNPNVSQQNIDNATIALQQAINNLV